MASDLTNLQALKDFTGSEWELDIELGHQLSVDKLGWLKNANRDFLKMTPQLIDAGQQGFNDFIKKAGTISPDTLEQAVKQGAGTAIARFIASRFSKNTDVRMSPLSPAWIKKKGNSKIGIGLTLELITDVVNMKFTVRRVK